MYFLVTITKITKKLYFVKNTDFLDETLTLMLQFFILKINTLRKHLRPAISLKMNLFSYLIIMNLVNKFMA